MCNDDNCNWLQRCRELEDKVRGEKSLHGEIARKNRKILELQEEVRRLRERCRENSKK